jgi:hypothetical protein
MIVPPTHGRAATDRIIQLHLEGGVAVVAARFIAAAAWQSRISSARAKSRLGEIVETALFARMFFSHRITRAREGATSLPIFSAFSHRFAALISKKLNSVSTVRRASPPERSRLGGA